MTRVILPVSAQYNLAREQLAERHGALRWFDRQLKDVDPALELVRAKEVVTEPGMTPGFWHVKRNNGPGVIDSYVPITNPDGSFAEPSSGWLERFRADDAWTNGGWDAMVKRWDRRQRDLDAQKERERQDRVQEIAERVKAIGNPGVSMTDAKPWSYRAGARRGR